jgi:MFS family permease
LDWVRSLRDGIVYVRRAPDVLLILTTGFIGAAGYGVFNVLFPIMAGSVWGSQRNQTYGLIMSCLGAGLAAGSAISGLLGTRYDGLRMYGMA